MSHNKISCARTRHRLSWQGGDGGSAGVEGRERWRVGTVEAASGGCSVHPTSSSGLLLTSVSDDDLGYHVRRLRVEAAGLEELEVSGLEAELIGDGLAQGLALNGRCWDVVHDLQDALDGIRNRPRPAQPFAHDSISEP